MFKISRNDPRFNCERLLLTCNNSDFSGMKWEDSLNFFAANVDRYLKGEEIIGVIDKKAGIMFQH